MILGLIPARGGSKRIPKKNVKNFCGKPIIAYAIENLKKTKIFDDIIVSTDDIEIQKISKKYGALSPYLRSKKNSSDFATTMDVILEVLEEQKMTGKKYDYVCCMYPCTPLLSQEIIHKSLTILKQNNYDLVFPIIKYSFPIQRAVKINNLNRIEMINPEYLTSRSQDLPETFHDAGQFYYSAFSHGATSLPH